MWLWWEFDQALNANDIRFVHVTDAAGALVAQQDNTLGAIDGGETRAEAVEIALPADLPPGITRQRGLVYLPGHHQLLHSEQWGRAASGALTLGTVAVTD